MVPPLIRARQHFSAAASVTIQGRESDFGRDSPGVKLLILVIVRDWVAPAAGKVIDYLGPA